jgi:hypothetical protein
MPHGEKRAATPRFLGKKATKTLLVHVLVHEVFENCFSF